MSSEVEMNYDDHAECGFWIFTNTLYYLISWPFVLISLGGWLLSILLRRLFGGPDNE